MGRIVSALFNEDLDLNAAAGAITAAPNQLAGITRDGTDTLVMPNVQGMYITKIAAVDETVGGAGMGYLTFLGVLGDRRFQFGEREHIGDDYISEIYFPPGVFPVAPKQKIQAVGNQSGSGAEQHSVIIDFWHPGLPDIPVIGNQPCAKGIIMVAMKTGSLVAATISGDSSVLGDVTAYEDSQARLSTDSNSTYALLQLGNYPGGAGYSVCGIRAPDGLSDRLFPATIGNVQGKQYEIGYVFSGDAPPRLVACGVGTTSTQYELTIGQIA